MTFCVNRDYQTGIIFTQVSDLQIIVKNKKIYSRLSLKRGSLRNGAVAQRLSERQQAIAGLRSLQILTITGNITCRRQPPADTIKKQKMSGNAILYGKK